MSRSAAVCRDHECGSDGLPPPASLHSTKNRLMKNSISSISFTTLFLIAVLTPRDVRADILTQSDVRLTAEAEFSSQRVPQITDFDSAAAPPDQVFTNAQALVKSGLPFPNVPNSQNSGF